MKNYNAKRKYASPLMKLEDLPLIDVVCSSPDTDLGGGVGTETEQETEMDT